MITMQMPGIFTVTGVGRRAVEIVSDEGVRLRVTEASLRRMVQSSAPAQPPEDDADAS